MNEENKAFKQNLDTIIELFKQIKIKIQSQDLSGIDRMFYENIEMLISNYEVVKDNLSDELLNEIGPQVKTLISDFVVKLKSELDEQQVSDQNIREDLEDIDKLLQNPSLSNEEINELLDKRSKIKGEDKENK